MQELFGMEDWITAVVELGSVVAAAKRTFGMREFRAKQRKLLMHMGRVFSFECFFTPPVLGFGGHVWTSGFSQIEDKLG
jgi:hypothetical protein